MLAPVVLLALLVAAPIALPPSSNAIGAVPDEPGAFVLPDARILQTVVADLEGGGRRELVRLVRGEDDAALAEVWAEKGPGWGLLGEPVEVVPPSRVGMRIDPVFQATPVRLLVRRVDGTERVTVASQPHFEEIDSGEPCCLLLHDLVIDADGGVRREEVAASSDFADVVLVIDFDGDGTDELLVTQSLPPLGDTGYPTEARVHRWAGRAFAPPIVTELSIGSGDAPFVLGDSDGIPGAEAGLISTRGAAGLFRISAGPGDRLTVDDAGLTADQALAVPLAEGRGVAVTGPLAGFVVAPWPAGGAMSPPVGASQLSDVRLLGTLAVEGEPRLAVHRPGSATLHLLSLPELTPWRETSIARSLAAARLSARPPDPYIGPLPGGALIHAGTLVAPTAVGDASTPASMATLAGAEPIGFVADETVLAVHHAPLGPAAPGPRGGPLTVPATLPLAWTSIVPFDLVRTPEADAGALAAAIRGAVRLDAGNDVAVGRSGLTAEVSAPPGSRVIVSDGASVSRLPVVVPAGGLVEIRLGEAADEAATARRRARLVVTTPAGHAYLAVWDILIRSGPPPIEVELDTPFGSSMVDVRGATLPHATVRVDGRAVEVSEGGTFATRVQLPPWPADVLIEVDDSLGNVARTTVSGVGWFDYRGLPWVPIVGAIVGGAALFLVLRVPRLNPLPRPADDDSALEELEPD